MRNVKIDLLRFIGLSMIILAHVNPPALIFQLRNFDVPLMVIVSGLAFTLTTEEKSYGLYIWKRIKRLVFPVWIFLSIYFLCIGLRHSGMGPLTFASVFGSYTLMDGIGYVWIIRVFLLVAFAAPLLTKLKAKIKDNKAYLISILFLYLAYEFLLHLTLPHAEGLAGKFLTSYVYYGIAYSLIFAVGIRIQSLSRNTCILAAAFSLSVFVLLGAYYYSTNGRIVLTQEHKYPPSAYYVFYALFVSFLIWIVGDKLESFLIKQRYLMRVILFIAKNSIWIYLWHIPFASYATHNFIFKYVAIYSVAILITFIQVSVVNKLLLPSITRDATRKNVKTIFTG